MQAPINETSFSLKRKLPSCNVDPSLIQRLERIVDDIPILRDEDTHSATAKIKISIAGRDEEEELASIACYRRSYFHDDTRRITITAGSSWKNKTRIQFDRDPLYSTIDIQCQSPNARSDAKQIYDYAIDIVKDHRNRNSFLHPSMPLLQLVLAPLSYAAFYMAYLFMLKSFVVHASRAAFIGLAIQIYTNAHRIKPYTEFKTKLNEERSRWFNWFVFTILEFILISLALSPMINFFATK
jgi:hypothetical protein